MNELRLPIRDYVRIRALFDSDVGATEFCAATADAILDSDVPAERAAKVFEAQALIAKAVAKQARRKNIAVMFDDE